MRFSLDVIYWAPLLAGSSQVFSVDKIWSVTECSGAIAPLSTHHRSALQFHVAWEWAWRRLFFGAFQFDWNIYGPVCAFASKGGLPNLRSPLVKSEPRVCAEESHCSVAQHCAGETPLAVAGRFAPPRRNIAGELAAFKLF